MGGIFISYRRKDSGPYAGRLYDALGHHFGAGQVFRDIGGIKPGERFPLVIERAVGACDALLAVIGPQWLSVEDDEGRRRLDDPNDSLRQEVETALRRDDVLVIPVLIGSTPMPGPADLPESLAALAEHNAVRVSDETWEDQIPHLIRALEPVLRRPAPAPKEAAVPAPTRSHPPEPVRRSRPRWLWAVAGVVVAALFVAAALNGSGGNSAVGGQKAPLGQVLVEPRSGSPGTTIEVSGPPCLLPSEWVGGEIFFGLHDFTADTDAEENPDKGEVTSIPGEPWSGRLTIPDGPGPAAYGVYAGCHAFDPNGVPTLVGAYLDARFDVIRT